MLPLHRQNRRGFLSRTLESGKAFLNQSRTAQTEIQTPLLFEAVDFDDENKVVGYGETGRVKRTTLTKEFFVPGFLERDEGEREKPFEKYPWDGVSGVRPFHEFAKTTTVGVY